MRIAINKNKTYSWVVLTGLSILLASFLFFPIADLLAQEDIADSETTESQSTEDDVADNSNGSILIDLNDEIDAKRDQLEDLKKKTDIYEDSIKTKQQESITLNNQMALIDLQVVQTETDIERIRVEIEGLNLELEKLGIEIDLKLDELNYNEEVLAEFLRLIYRYDQQTYLEIFMSNGSFSDFFDNLRYTHELQGNVENALVETKLAKADLDSKQASTEEKKDDLSLLTDKLSGSITDLNSQKDYKGVLLDDTKESEETFQALLEEARREQEAAQAEIGTLEKKAREKLLEEGVDLDIEATLMWPIAPFRGISAYFHDPTYPYRKYFEHPAIDIPSPQGTPIRAADNGYIVRAKNAGLGYSFIMIVHTDTISTVYGHISRIDVAEDEFVVRGQQIGLVGGLPGTPGAGRLTTGSHLHFEVRSGGIPVNPLDYLPAI
ncbi:peptidoglycan DD-metalloendopeptidase family protein [Patescibacteria group bacterium]|nr:peptidoglycan DD-metalloendopeptidase family protein [Patescibacteria group bacterium]